MPHNETVLHQRRGKVWGLVSTIPTPHTTKPWRFAVFLVSETASFSVSRRSLPAALLCLGAVYQTGCLDETVRIDAQANTSFQQGKLAPDDIALPSTVWQPVREALREGNAQSVLVVYGAPTAAEAIPSVVDAEWHAAFLAAEAASLQTQADAQFDQLRDAQGNLPHGVEMLRHYEHIPMMQLEVRSENALDAILQKFGAESVFVNAVYEKSLAQSLALINQPQVLADGKDGNGTAVAVLDTGVDYKRAAFGTCINPGDVGCSVVVARDFALEDNVLDADGHGTNVAGIVVGVAPKTKVLALDVFNGTGASLADIVAAIDFVITQQAAFNIVSINMSLGGGGSTTPCSGSAFGPALSRARNAGILPIVATGNNGFTNAISEPACHPSAVSVGAVYDSNVGPLSFSVCSDSSTAADKVTCFSNSASFASLLAPGALITAAGITQAGTSQATPHVAGAVAVVRSAFNTESAEQALLRLRNGGKAVRDARNGITLPRLDLAASATNAPCIATFSPNTLSITSAGSSTVINIQAPIGCAWTANSDADFVTINGLTSLTGSGNASVTVAVAKNTGALRTAAVTSSAINGTASLDITQAGAEVTGTGPEGTIVLASGSVFSTSLQVEASLNSADATVTEMCLSNTNTCTSFVPFSPTIPVTLSPGDGTKTVFAFFKNSSGLVSTTPAQDSIVVDTTLPSSGSLSVAKRGNGISGRIGTATDANGVAKYRVVVKTNATPANCDDGQVVYDAVNAGSFSHNNVARNNTYNYRLCVTDSAGNRTTGILQSLRL